jgi:hypothetical protein
MKSDLYIFVTAFLLSFFPIINYDMVMEIFNKDTITFCLNPLKPSGYYMYHLF